MAEQTGTEPSGSQNRIKNIALVGGGGRIGSYILKFLLLGGKHHVTVLSRPASTSVFPSHPSLTIKNIDYASPVSIVTALTGQDVLVITMAATAPLQQESFLIYAAAQAKVPLIMPNEWGPDFTHQGLAEGTPIIAARLATHRGLIEDIGVSKWLAVTGGFWYEYSLASTEWMYGFDFKKKKVIFNGDGTVKINTSTWEQYARAVTALLSLPIVPVDSEDSSSTLSNFHNKHCFISSFRVSQKDIFESVLRVTGTKECDWAITHEDAKARRTRCLDLSQRDYKEGFRLAMYARNFYDDGAGDFETRHGLTNDLLGLPIEDLDACTAKAVERAEKLAETY
ncbi:related to oxidoreductase CipA-like [Rhynchosporium secalis]|uniref:Related to oxidoreductase CipA-like n=1 Tax=Rhynchosporium secalis TaxID=38038 RepID=A0A1E1M9I2_RHYSE|nr:related to oxidoreductase CipA-like [Rhynchosporium secalis]